jgi:spore coat polysaccharide biosynthesis predicted glycosyltransferase SpsG
MQDIIEQLFDTLNSVLPGKVSYGTREGLENDPNYIIYQELNQKTIVFADDKAQAKVSTFQVSLITEKKDLYLEQQLETTLYYMGYEFELLSEFVNEDSSVNRVYEIKQEVF